MTRGVPYHRRLESGIDTGPPSEYRASMRIEVHDNQVESALKTIDKHTKREVEALPQDVKTRMAQQLAADMKGLKMRAYNPATSKIAELVGVSQVQVSRLLRASLARLGESLADPDGTCAV